MKQQRQRQQQYRVPLGFVCGYPVGNGGELYGGSMFIKSAASDTLQGKAIQSVNERWGQGKWTGTETIGIAVCKKKYNPFNFYVDIDDDGRKIVRVERMFGCHCHSSIRRRVIELNGLRTGWEPFGQWSMRKAQELARKETERLNSNNHVVADSSDSDSDHDGHDAATGDGVDSLSDSVNDSRQTATSKQAGGDGDGDDADGHSTPAYSSSEESVSNEVSLSSDDELRNICSHGKCAWKRRAKYDNIHQEVLGFDSSGEDF
uniref:Uncharacterized protein n=1 Tax=Craspedostauros australis TaxID=1486917 RepID=A0A7R9WNJ4_9STRA|mmetsp:Transcript_13320/g.36809  ORF Transcript_13320/g.36809 Transcript_13320/m.36809 type:complete len:261 (+) Transcript_13320:138-920(+)